VQWLQRRGYEAYLVGGCVRDLLLGLSPKDFDIATSALPAQVRRVFPRNCRIIGGGFKLAHLHFHNNTKILECSTFPAHAERGAHERRPADQAGQRVRDRGRRLAAP
jgi:poly(A) polymerase